MSFFIYTWYNYFGDLMYKKILSFGLFLTIIDQIIKYLVVINLKFTESIKVISNFFYITYIRNTGAAFGIFQNGGIILIILSIIAIIGLIKYVIEDKFITRIEAVSYSFVFGGILGNLIDRVINGYVIDYLDFYIFGYDYPVFNFADILIVIGFGIILVNLFIKGEHNENNKRRR